MRNPRPTLIPLLAAAVLLHPLAALAQTDSEHTHGGVDLGNQTQSGPGAGTATSVVPKDYSNFMGPLTQDQQAAFDAWKAQQAAGGALAGGLAAGGGPCYYVYTDPCSRKGDEKEKPLPPGVTNVDNPWGGAFCTATACYQKDQCSLISDCKSFLDQAKKAAEEAKQKAAEEVKQKAAEAAARTAAANRNIGWNPNPDNSGDFGIFSQPPPNSNRNPNGGGAGGNGGGTSDAGGGDYAGDGEGGTGEKVSRGAGGVGSVGAGGSGGEPVIGQTPDEIGENLLARTEVGNSFASLTTLNAAVQASQQGGVIYQAAEKAKTNPGAAGNAETAKQRTNADFDNSQQTDQTVESKHGHTNKSFGLGN